MKISQVDQPNVVKFTLPENLNAEEGKDLWSSIFYNLMKIGWKVILSTDVQMACKDSLFVFERISEDESQNFENLNLAYLTFYEASNDGISSIKLKSAGSQEDHKDLTENLAEILNESWKQDGENGNGNKQDFHQHIQLSSKTTQFYLQTLQSSVLSKSAERLAFTQICGKLGKKLGWNYLVNGQIRCRTDSVWFYKNSSSENSNEKSNFDADQLFPVLHISNSKNGVEILNFPEEITKILSEKLSLPALENPWRCNLRSAVKSRMALNNCVDLLKNQGYSVLTCLDLSRTHLSDDKCTIVFNKEQSQSQFDSQNSTTKKSYKSMLFSISGKDEIRFIGDFTDQELEQLMVPVTEYSGKIKSRAFESNSSGIGHLRENIDRSYRVEFSICAPFDKCPQNLPQTLQIKSMLMRIFVIFGELGWRVAFSGEVNSEIEHIVSTNVTKPKDVDSWFLYKEC